MDACPPVTFFHICFFFKICFFSLATMSIYIIMQNYAYENTRVPLSLFCVHLHLVSMTQIHISAQRVRDGFIEARCVPMSRLIIFPPSQNSSTRSQHVPRH